MVRIYYTIFESISHEGEMGDEFNGFKRFNRFTGLAPGAYRPLIACERGEAGSVGSTGSKGLMVLRTYRHPERSRGIFLAEPLAQQLRYFNHRLLPIPNP